MAQKVSVVMAARNAATTIEQALNSVLACRETGQVIVIDDGSTDATRDKALSIGDPRIDIVDGPMQGAGAATQTGLMLARLPFVSICDSDDFIPNDRFEWQLAWLEANPDFVAVSGGFSSVDTDGSHVADLSVGVGPCEVQETLKGGDVITSLCTFLTRTDALQKLGGVRPWFRAGYDIDFQLRLAETGRIWHEPRISYFWRLHEKSTTHSFARELNEFYLEKAKLFQKQRKSGVEDDLAAGRPPTPPENNTANVLAAKDHVAQQLESAAWLALKEGDRQKAMSKMFKSLQRRPISLGAWRSILVMSYKAFMPFRR
ncbi:MAG: glycosyltransferase family A protein [Pseudomonadota bacterium]